MTQSRGVSSCVWSSTPKLTWAGWPSYVDGAGSSSSTSCRRIASHPEPVVSIALPRTLQRATEAVGFCQGSHFGCGKSLSALRSGATRGATGRRSLNALIPLSIASLVFLRSSLSSASVSIPSREGAGYFMRAVSRIFSPSSCPPGLSGTGSPKLWTDGRAHAAVETYAPRVSRSISCVPYDGSHDARRIYGSHGTILFKTPTSSLIVHCM